MESIKKDDILVISWGYEQTNVTFFKVIKRTPKMVEIERLKKQTVEISQGGFAGKVVPLNEGTGEVCRCAVKAWNDGERANTKYGLAKLWDKQPKNFTSYH